METKKSPDDKIANLKNISEIDNKISEEVNDFVISTASEEHVPELAELWANHATIQQIFAPERYNFKFEGKNWRDFVKRKMAKGHNLLLAVTKKGNMEVKGFIYLQTVTLPSSNLVLKGVIEDLYTKPQHRKKGIATMLLSTAMSWGEKNGIKHIELVSPNNTKEMMKFYKNFVDKSKHNIHLELVTI